ncbi:MAG: hypothetical protein JWN37_312 [Candidatus Nomurabacteria bacterium]|nr:hypothetical protein [Candidatus Nomurabacteria bacterium]
MDKSFPTTPPNIERADGRVEIKRAEILDALAHYRGDFIKFASLRTSPYIANKKFDSLRKEYEVLSQMYLIDNEHVAAPIFLDEKERFMVIERLLGYESIFALSWYVKDLLERNPSFLGEVKIFVENLHKEGIAHGDLLGNILVSLDTDKDSENNGKILNWAVVDPVGITKDSEAFVEAVDLDNKALERLSDIGKAKHFIENEEMEQIETPEAPEVRESQDNNNKENHVVTALLNQGIHLVPEGTLSIREYLRERNETVNTFYVRKTEFAAALIKPISDSIIGDPFQDIEKLIIETLLRAGKKDVERLTVHDTERIIMCAHRLQQNIIGGIKFISDIEDMKEEGSLDQDVNLYLVKGAVAVVYDRENYDSAGFLGDHFDEDVSHGYPSSASQVQYKGMNIPYFTLPKKNIEAYIINHEARHATINRAVFEQNLQYIKEDFHLKEEVVAYLSCNENIETIIGALEHFYGYSNYFHFNDMVYALRKLEDFYTKEELADILSVVPISEWRKFTKSKLKEMNISTTEVKTPTTPRF